jgi:hypothetical protein
MGYSSKTIHPKRIRKNMKYSTVSWIQNGKEKQIIKTLKMNIISVFIKIFVLKDNNRMFIFRQLSACNIQF